MDKQADKTSSTSRGPAELPDGFEYAFRYCDPISRMYEVTNSRFEAESIVGDDYETVLVHFTDGFLDRIVGRDSHKGRGYANNDGGKASLFDDMLTAGAPSDFLGDAFPSGERRTWGDSRNENRNRARRPDCPENGLGLAYRYVDPSTGAFGWASDSKKASSIAGDDYEIVWVRYRRGRIDRAATADEYEEELEVRVGERISEGMSATQLNEFDLIDNQAEATRWLERNRPDYRDIVEATIREMERGVVLSSQEDEALSARS